MRNWIFALLAISLAPLAHAERMPPSGIVAEVVTAGGLSPEPPPRVQGVRVFEDGEVVHFSGPRLESFLRLSPDRMEKLGHQVQQIRDEDLVDLDAGAPYCADAPETHYRVYRGGSAPIAIAAYRSCHRYALRDGQGEGLREFLDHLMALDFW